MSDKKAPPSKAAPAKETPATPAESHVHATLRERMTKLSEGHPLIKAFGLDLAVVYGLPYAIGKIKEIFEQKYDHQKHKVKNSQCFGEALSALSTSPATFADFELLVDFLSHGLKTEHQREQFIINAAKVGEEVKETTAFLLGLARMQDPGDHSARVEYLRNLGFIDKVSKMKKVWDKTKSVAGEAAKATATHALSVAGGASTVIESHIVTPVKNGLDNLENRAASPNNAAKNFRNRMRKLRKDRRP